MSKINPPAFLAGFALGTAAGSALALLLAPAPGQETQQRLRKRAPELGDHCREAAQMVLVRSKETATRSWAGLTSTAEEVKARLRRESSAGPSSEGAVSAQSAPEESA